MDGDTILVATDLSDNARPAAKVGQALAKALGRKVEVMHVFDLTRRDSDKKMKVLEDPELRKRAISRVGAWYNEVVDEEADAVTVIAGAPDQGLRARAEEDDVACLVVAMSGRGAWNRLVFGSTAQKLAGRPPCVTAIAHPEHHNVKKGMTLGLGTDFSPMSEEALEQSVFLAQTFDAPLRIVFANALPSTTVIHEGELPPGMETTEVINWAQDSMDAFTSSHEELLDGVDWESEIIADYPVAGIRSFVEDHGVDWMILGHRRPKERGGATTVKGKWVRQMTCSTLIVPTERSMK